MKRPNLPHYHINEKIYDGRNSTVYRAVRAVDQQPVILKFVKNRTNDPNVLIRYRCE
jgi:serine/threonine protein kinase